LAPSRQDEMNIYNKTKFVIILSLIVPTSHQKTQYLIEWAIIDGSEHGLLNMDIRRNNFDLLRLFAALQVFFGHALSHLEIKSPILQSISGILAAFPGVPIFFMISGFLITASYERNTCLKQYTINRVLRIYPALWVAFIISIIMISNLDYLHLSDLSDFLVWSFCQLSLFQFYNPSFLRGFGVGVLNGSLWTITVELQFYLLVPMFYALIKKYTDWNHREKFFWALFVAAILINIICNQISGTDNYSGHGTPTPLLIKLLNVTILPYLYCFLIGALLQLHFDKIQKFVVGKFKFLSYLTIYLALYLFLRESMTFHYSNPFTMMVLALPVISFAFSFTNLSNVLLKGNDLSYGIYIYHMLIINALVYFGFIGAWYFLLLTIMSSSVLAALSWILIEQPALALKHNPLRKIVSEDYSDQNKEVRAISS